jgi:uncharacterized repeat protein (TIGR01451 family)
VRKRPILLAAAAVAAGFAVFGTVRAQQPGTNNQTKVVPAVGTAPTVRPYTDWTPNPPPAGYTPTQPGGGVTPASAYLPVPAGYAGQAAGQGTRPRLTTPTIAGPEGVYPAGDQIPPPSMELPAMRPDTPTQIAPPSVQQEPGASDSKTASAAAAGDGKSAAPPLIPPSVGTDPRPPLTPTPSLPTPVGGAPHPIVPIGPSTPVPPLPPSGGTSGIPQPNWAIQPPASGTSSDNSSSTGSGAVRSTTTSTSSLPGKSTQNVTLEAVCPDTVVFGGEFRYELVIKNAGMASVSGVRVEDELPLGAKYVGSDPPAEVNSDRLSWAVGTLEAGGEKRIAVRVKPTDEGDLRSRATVSYSASVDARTKVTRPRIAVAVTGIDVCKAGEEAIFQIKVSNTGTGPAQQMILQAMLSDGLVHPQGMKLEMSMAPLPPGESKTIPLKVSAAKAGVQVCQVTVAAQGSQDAIGKANVNVVEPLLHVAQTGPAKCLVRGAEPVYEITLSNPGTAATDPISLYAVLPEGFEYVQASDSAAYSASNRAIVWKLIGLAPGGTKAFTLKLRATVAGDGVLRTIAQAQPEQSTPGTVGAGGIAPARPAVRVLEAKAETAIKAEGVAAARFDVKALENPVEVGKEAIYEIRVTNQGTGVCTNVQLVAALAEGTAYTGSSGPTQVKAQGQNLIFDPIPTLGVKGEMVYQVKVRGAVAGDLRFRVQLSCDQVRTPVVKEESTRFYKE